MLGAAKVTQLGMATSGSNFRLARDSRAPRRKTGFEAWRW